MIYSASATARYSGDMAEDLLPHIASHAREVDLQVQETEGSLVVTLPHARVAFEREQTVMQVRIDAADAVNLHNIREYVLYILDHVSPGIAAEAVWEGDITHSSTPPSFTTATVEKIWRVAPSVLRIEMSCADTRRLAEGKGMHFSLLLPPDETAPIWPQLDENGRTVWPKGKDALHRAVYTFVSLDEDEGRFTFDLFEHEGGRATGWAQTARPGEVVGIMGPGSGDFPPGRDLLIAGDETALPAIRRILSHSAPDRQGRVLLEVESARDICDLPHPDAMEITWVLREKGSELWDHLENTDLPASQDRYVWVAAEKELVRKAKKRFRDQLGLCHDRGYFAYYWAS